jgi:hypothetical protein
MAPQALRRLSKNVRHIEKRLPWKALCLVLAAAACWAYFTGHFFQTWESLVASLAFLTAFYELQKNARHFANERQRIENITRSISTRYARDFPHHVEEIIDVLRGARKEFLFMADCVDYSSFSYPEGYRKYQQLLFDVLKDKKVDVRILVCGHPAGITRTSPLFDSTWDQLKSSKEMEYFFSVFCGGTPPANLERLNSLLLDREKADREELKTRGAHIRLLSHFDVDVGPFLWIGDADMVFVLLAKGSSTSAVAFRTRDSKIIECFRAIFEVKWNAASPIAGPPPEGTDGLPIL